MKNVFQAELAQRMKERDMTPLELCAAIDRHGLRINVVSVERWLAGHTYPRLRAARLAADALGCSLDDLYPSDVHAGSSSAAASAA